MKNLKRLTLVIKIYTNDFQTTILNMTVFTEHSARSEISNPKVKGKKCVLFFYHIHIKLYTNDLQTTILNMTAFTEHSARSEISNPKEIGKKCVLFFYHIYTKLYTIRLMHGYIDVEK
jgi:hypothetical protein